MAACCPDMVNAGVHHGVHWYEACFLGHGTFASLIPHFHNVPGLDESGLDISQQDMEPSLAYLPAGALGKGHSVPVAYLGPCGQLAPRRHLGITAVALGKLSYGEHLLGSGRLGLMSVAVSGKRPGSWSIINSLGSTCWRRCCSYALVRSSLVAQALIVLCLRSAVKQLGRWPCPSNRSGRWRSQCHFFIRPTVGKAFWKVEMASSAMRSREALVVALDMTPKWHWSRSSAWC